MPLRAPSLQITEAEARCCLGARSGRGPRRESSQRVREAAYQNLGCAHGAGVIRVVGLLRQSWSKPRWVNASENPRMSKVRPVDAPGWRAETCTSRVPLRNTGYSAGFQYRATKPRGSMVSICATIFGVPAEQRQL